MGERTGEGRMSGSVVRADRALEGGRMNKLHPFVRTARCSLAPVLVLLLASSCGTSGVSSVGGTTRASVEDALKLESDCIQYRVAVDAKGIETWNADYVYFYLWEGDHLAKDEHGKPVGQGLRHSQLREFMRQHPEYGENTNFSYQVSRQVQRVHGGLVLSTSPPETVPDVDLDSLLTLAGR
jgi:hypothetical protein